MSSLAKGVSSKLTASDREFQFAARETRVSNIIQTGARDRPKLANANRFPSPTASARGPGRGPFSGVMYAQAAFGHVHTWRNGWGVAFKARRRRWASPRHSGSSPKMAIPDPKKRIISCWHTRIDESLPFPIQEEASVVRERCRCRIPLRTKSISPYSACQVLS
jgi:hypothetical protein